MMINQIFSQKKGLLFLVLLLAVILRCYNIDQPYTDLYNWRQVSTAMMAENFFKTNANIFYPEVNWAGPGPSYQGREFQTITYLAAIGYHIFGQADWIGRVLAMLFGIWGIFSLYQLIKLVWDEDYALAGAFMMAIMPGSALVEQSFLPDPAMVALMTSACWMYLKYMNDGRITHLVLATSLGTLGALTKIPGLILGLPLLYAMIAIYSKRKELSMKILWPLFLSAFVLLGITVVYYLWAKYLSEHYPPYHFAGNRNWIWDNELVEWFSLKEMFHDLYWITKNLIWTKPILFLFGIGFLMSFIPVKRFKPAYKEDHSTTKLPWFFHFWILAMAIFYVIGYEELLKNPWNFHIMNPAAAAISGAVIVHSFSLVKPYLKQYLLVVGLLASLLILLDTSKRKLIWMHSTSFEGRNPEQSMLLGKEVKMLSKEGDLFLVIPNGFYTPLPIYYSSRRGWTFPNGGYRYKKMDNKVAGKSEEMIKLFEAHRTCGMDWFGIVEEHIDFMYEHNPGFMKYINESCTLVKEDEHWGVIYKVIPNEKQILKLQSAPNEPLKKLVEIK